MGGPHFVYLFIRQWTLELLPGCCEHAGANISSRPSLDFGTLLLNNFHGPGVLVSGTHLPYCKGTGGHMMVSECRAHWTPGRVGDAGGRRGQEIETWGSGEPIPSCTDWTPRCGERPGTVGRGEVKQEPPVQQGPTAPPPERAER